MAVPAIGTPAPDFTLPSTSGAEVTLSKLRGKNVLLAFFPLAFTSTCTAELCAFSDDYAQFEQAGAVVLPISVDAVPSLRAFKQQERLAVDLLSDFRREVTRRYDLLLEERFYAKRAYILIDRVGVVRWTYVEDTPSTRRENAELLAQLRQLA